MVENVTSTETIPDIPQTEQTPPYTNDVDEVLKRERERIGREPLWGLAISGGGIRSASFGLGVLQALVEKGLLKDIDYLSTVSGGGYIGSSLTWFLNRKTKGQTRPGTDRGSFPFEDRLVAQEGEVRPNPTLEFIRQHGNYLVPGRGLNAASLVAVVARSMSVSLFIYGGLLTGLIALLCLSTLLPTQADLREKPESPVAQGEGPQQVAEAPAEAETSLLPALLAMRSKPIEQQRAEIFQRIGLPERLRTLSSTVAGYESELEPESMSLLRDNPMLRFSLALLGFFLLLSIVYALVSSSKWFVRAVKATTTLSTDEQGVRYEFRTGAQRVFGWLLGLAGITAVLGFVPVVSHILSPGTFRVAAGASGGSTFVGAVLSYSWQQLQQRERSGREQSAMAKLGEAALLYAAAGLVIFGVLLGCYALVNEIGAVYAVGVGVASTLVGGLVNLNYHSQHRMYRDRLMEAFMPNSEQLESGDWGRATEADDLGIHQVCAAGWNPRPYHLINTNVVLVDSPTARYRGRGGDSFILSPIYCGSHATGWAPSETYMTSWRNRGMTLPTAMAISGAAANPNTGVAGRGPTRSRVLSILMSLLNLRLGYWAPNPRFEDRSLRVRRPNFLRPGAEAVVGRGLSEDQAMVELSDGGHFENLGLYELVRRRVKNIIVSDAGCDPKFEFGDLSNAIERVRADFGVKIDFAGSPKGLADLLPKSPYAPADDKIEVAGSGYAIAKIHYPEVPDGNGSQSPKHRAEVGELVYIKSTLIPELPLDVYAYRLQNEAFPHETTADQAFTEAQLEAYRELGFGIAMSLAP